MTVERAIALGVLVALVQPASALALAIEDVRHHPLHVGDYEGLATIEFVLSEPAQATVEIYDGRDILIRTIATEGDPARGLHEIQWDLRDRNGSSVPPGAYHYRLKAEDDAGEPVVWDIWDTTGGQRLRETNARFAEDPLGVAYSLPETGLVRIRIGLEGHGPLMRTLVDWVPRMRGQQLEVWDGLDQSGVIRLADHPRLAVQLDAVSLPKNTIVVGRASPNVVSIEDLPESIAQRPALTRRYRMHDYLRQAMQERRDISAAFALPEDRRDDNGRPVLRGKVPVRLSLAEEDQRRLANERFEAVFFIDGLFAFEVESGYFPITWRWDTEGVDEGVHYVTANLRGYEGHFAIATVEVQVERTK
jgi:hypothetical protein